MPRVPFFWVDVFAEEPLAGNPLTVVPDADELTEAQMRAITREFNQSETTFLVTPSLDGADHRLRSFTPGGVEVLGAGHNAMGVWIWLAASAALPVGRTDFTQQIGEQLLPVRVDRSAGRVRVAMEQAAPRFLTRTDRLEVLEAALGLDRGAIRTDVPTQVASTGAEHLLVPIRSAAAVDGAEPNPVNLKLRLAEVGAEGCYLYALTPEHDDLTASARFFNPTVGISEDPATGTAAGPLAALLVNEGLAEPGTVRIEQGRAMGRPSVLEVFIDGDRVTLSGSGVLTGEGHLNL